MKCVHRAPLHRTLSSERNRNIKFSMNVGRCSHIVGYSIASYLCLSLELMLMVLNYVCSGLFVCFLLLSISSIPTPFNLRKSENGGQTKKFLYLDLDFDSFIHRQCSSPFHIQTNVCCSWDAVLYYFYDLWRWPFSRSSCFSRFIDQLMAFAVV